MCNIGNTLYSLQSYRSMEISIVPYLNEKIQVRTSWLLLIPSDHWSSLALTDHFCDNNKWEEKENKISWFSKFYSIKTQNI